MKLIIDDLAFVSGQIVTAGKGSVCTGRGGSLTIVIDLAVESLVAMKNDAMTSDVSRIMSQRMLKTNENQF